MNPSNLNLTPTTGRVISETDSVVNVIDRYGAIKVETPENSAVHSSIGFDHSSRNTLGIGGIAYLMFVTGTKQCHMMNNFLKSSEAPLDIDFFESPTVSANGTLLASTSRNRVSPGTATALVYGGPTVTSTGIQLSTDSIYGSNKAGGDNVTSDEWLLAPNTKYLFRVTNNSGKSISYVGGFFWIENNGS
jgi:hypothetical protein